MIYHLSIDLYWTIYFSWSTHIDNTVSRISSRWMSCAAAAYHFII